MRGTSGLFRPFYDGSVWLQEGWAAWYDAGGRREGRESSRRDFGLADETFIGHALLSRTASRATPTGARGLAGEAASDLDTLAWSARYYGQNDHVSWEDDGRNVESDPTRVLRDAFEARVSYLLNKGLWSLKPAVSLRVRRLERDGGPGSSEDCARSTSRRRSGRSRSSSRVSRARAALRAGAPCRLGYDDGSSVLAGFAPSSRRSRTATSIPSGATTAPRRPRRSTCRGRLDAGEGPLGHDRVQCPAR